MDSRTIVRFFKKAEQLVVSVARTELRAIRDRSLPEELARRILRALE